MVTMINFKPHVLGNNPLRVPIWLSNLISMHVDCWDLLEVDIYILGQG